MGNYTKSFNFRNGVQVDDSNFIVNANGLVGIGTSIPEKRLDVRGNTKIIGDTRLVGLTSITDLNVVGVVTIGSAVKIDSGSGIITATKFVGDASGLTNIVAIATGGFVANVGSLHTEAKVGIGSTQPTSQLDVFGNSKFVGITTFTGITTSSDTLFANSLSVKTLSVEGISTFSDDVIVGTSATVGIGTTVFFPDDIKAKFGDDGDLEIYYDSTHDQGVISSNNKVVSIMSGNLVEIEDESGVNIAQFKKVGGCILHHDGGSKKFETSEEGIIVSGGTTTGTLDVTGVSTFAGNINANGNIIGDTASELSGFAAVRGTLVAAVTLRGSTGAGNKTFETVGTGATVYGKLDVARFAGGASGLSSHFGSLRYGNENDGESPYSTRRSLDLINTDSGNVNYYLNANNLSIPDSGSDFHWHKGFDNATLMTLTNTGVLGIGITIPDSTKKLHVLGGSKITGVSTFNSDLFVGNNLNVKGTLTVSLVTASVTGNLTGNVNASSGLSTFSGIKVTDKTETNFAGIGIGTTCSNLNYIETVNDAGFSTSKFIVNTEGKVAIGTDNIRDGIGLNAHKEKATFGAVGVGTTSPLAAVDFRDAGQDGVGVFANRMYMLPPQVDNNERTGLSTVTGAVIFNTTASKLQIYISDNWVDLH